MTRTTGTRIAVEGFTEQTWVVREVIDRRAKSYKVLWVTGETTWEPRDPDLCRTCAFAVWAHDRGNTSDEEAIVSSDESSDESIVRAIRAASA